MQGFAAKSPGILLRIDLGSKGSVGGQGSPPRKAREAAQVPPHSSTKRTGLHQALSKQAKRDNMQPLV